MKLLQKVKENLMRGVKNDLLLAIYSILIAIVVWFVIAITLYPSVPKTIQNVSLVLDNTSTNNSLSVISYDVEKVDIRIKGSRTQVGNLDSGSFMAYFDTDNVATPGKKSLNIKIRSSSKVNYEIESITPSTVNVVFDEFKSKEVPIKPQIPNVSVAEGKAIYAKEFSCDPEVISVTGPSAQLNKIKYANAIVEKEMVIDSTQNIPVERIEFFSDDDTKIDTTNLKFNTANLFVKVPVVTQKTVSLDVQLMRVPKNTFNTSFLKLKVSPETITIASKNNQAKIPDTLTISQIPLRDLRDGYSETFDISSILAANDLINQSGVETVTVSLENTGLMKRDLLINKENIRILNPPDDGNSYSLVTGSLPITVIGPESVIESITNDDFYAEANLLNTNSNLDQFTFEVLVCCSKSKNVWAIGQTNVLIQKTPIPDDADEGPEGEF
ncbi:MAG: CdaR family protein [Ruminococcus sp.]|nr:CdaR family protein [Ruminococcus sp.]